MNTAWFNTDVLPEDMIKGALALKPGWSRLEDTNHYKIFRRMLDKIKYISVADLGCGAGEMGRVLSIPQYVGFDLPHIIEKVSMKVNPTLTYKNFNANTYDYNNLSFYDLIICNSFISELPNAIEILEKILHSAKRHVIVHRQLLDNDTSTLETYKTYGDLNTARSIISVQDLNRIINLTDMQMVEMVNVDGNVFSFLLTKNRKIED